MSAGGPVRGWAGVGGRAGTTAVLAVGVTVTLWASAFVAIRHVGRELSGGALSLGRLLVAATVLGVMVAWQTWRARARVTGSGGSGAPGTPGPGERTGSGWPERALLGRLLVCGVLWFGVYNVALNEAERRLDAGTAAMLINTGPILIALLAGATLGEGFPRRLFAGVAIAFAGVLLIGVSSSSGLSADTVGVLLCLLAAASYAISVVAQKPLLVGTSALRVTWLACSIGAIACLPFTPVLVSELRSTSLSTVWWVVYLGVLPTAVAFTTWGVRVGEDAGREVGIDHLPGAAVDDRTRLARPGRGPGAAGIRRRWALPGRCGDHPPSRAAERARHAGWKLRCRAADRPVASLRCPNSPRRRS